MIKIKLNKGQGATEYLVILAVVIIIALIVVGVMGGIPGIGGAASNRGSSSYFSSADIAVVSFSQSAGALGPMTLKLQNNAQNIITIQGFAVGSTNILDSTNSTDDVSLNPGQSATITATPVAGDICNVGDGLFYNVNTTFIDSGVVYQYDYDENTLEGTCGN